MVRAFQVVEDPNLEIYFRYIENDLYLNSVSSALWFFRPDILVMQQGCQQWMNVIILVSYSGFSKDPGLLLGISRQVRDKFATDVNRAIKSVVDNVVIELRLSQTFREIWRGWISDYIFDLT